MNQEIKEKTITFGELKKMKIWVEQKWVENLFERGKRESGLIKLDVKDLINKILEIKNKG